MSSSALSREPEKEEFDRGDERRQEQMTPPDGEEKRHNIADRRAENNREYVTFYLGDQFVGIEVDQVREILPPQKVTDMPLAEKSVKGLLNLRGQIVTAIDVRSRLGMESRKDGDDYMNVIVTEDDEFFSLKVDRVGDVMSVARSRYSDAPTTLDEAWKTCSDGVFQLNDKLLVVLDVKKLVNFS